MKVYAVIVRCEDNYYPDYQILNDCVYPKEEDAKKRLDELLKEIPSGSEEFKIYVFEVKE